MSQQAKPAATRSQLTSMNFRPPRHLPLASAIALALSLSIASVQAATIIVDTASDTDSGACRLRDAIIAANTDTVVEGCTAGSGADSIRLHSSFGNTITLSGSRLPTVTSDITIQGDGVTINGAGTVALMAATGASASLKIDHMSLVNGNASGVGAEGKGGAIRADADATVAISNSTLSGNTANTTGGAIHVIYANNVTLRNSTVSGNSAGTDGGGIFVGFVVDKVELINSTLSGNTAGGAGGGIYGAVSGTTILVNSTLSGNQAGTQGGGLSGTYGSIFQLNNSVIANSVADYDCWEGVSIYSLEGVNLIEKQGPACSPSTPKLLSGDPALGVLANNGGPTLTHAIISGSPLIDASGERCNTNLFDNTGLSDILSDQRGFTRTDGDCDIGAVEYDAVARQSGPDFVVNSTDEPYIKINGNPTIVLPGGDGYCNESPGNCTLREAVAAANEFSDASIISFDDTLTTPPATIFLAGNQMPTVVSNITIQGSGLTLNARDRFIPDLGVTRSRFFEIDTSSLTINNLNLTKGIAYSGGAILVGDNSTLTVSNSTLTGNLAGTKIATDTEPRISGSGGAIQVGEGSTLVLSNSTLSGNTADDIGGGIYVGSGASANLVNISLLGNDAASNRCNPGYPDFIRCGGGGIFIQSGTVTLDNSTLNANQALSNGFGGGIRSRGGTLSVNGSTLSGNVNAGLFVEQSSFSLINSTVSGNSNPGDAGGGIVAQANSTGQITNSTLVDNEAAAGDGLFLNASTITLTNSIIANSTTTDCLASSGSIITTGKNLVRDGGGDCGLTPGASLLSGDPMLGPLADNGGLTRTHMPQPGSPVINAGDNAAVPEGLLYDQRGTGYPRLISVNVDLGAVEWNEIIFANGFEDPGP